MSKRWQRMVPLVGGALIVLIVCCALLLFIYRMMHNKHPTSTRQVAQTITLIRPPPPQETPPPPPPPPEKIETPVEQQPEQQPDQAPQQPLGIDADASAGGDSFGLQARPGGRDLIGDGTAPFKWYTSLMATRLQECFSEDELLRKGSYRANVRVHVETDGHLEIVQLLGSSGSPERDAAIRNLKNCSTGESRPLEMPQLATILIVSRG